MRVSVYHNILWSKYKGVVFTQLHRLCMSDGVEVSFVQIAETEGDRIALGSTDLSYHQYPFRLLFKGAYSRVPLLRRVAALVREVYQRRTDLVVMPGYDRIEYWAMLAMCIVTRRKRGVFCDSTAHDRQKSGWKETAKRIFFARCDVFLAYGIRSKEYLLSYGIADAKVTFGCQAAALPHTYDVAAVRTAYRERADAATQFLYVGRFSAEKGLLDLLNAFASYRAFDPDATLDLVGAGPQQASLESTAAQLGIRAQIRFPGPMSIEAVAPMFVKSAALILPSYSEPWGLVVNEALSYGCPAIVSNACGCVPELIVEGVTGFSFTAGNVEKLVAAMQAAAALAKNRRETSERCLGLISQYTPARAASNILAGCKRAVEPGA